MKTIITIYNNNEEEKVEIFKTKKEALDWIKIEKTKLHKSDKARKDLLFSIKSESKSKWVSSMEFQYKPFQEWHFCKYTAFVNAKLNNKPVRSRKVGTGNWHYEY